jgi:IS5 family transposase
LGTSANFSSHSIASFWFINLAVSTGMETVLEADAGYQGLALIHANSLLPKKRFRNYPLSKQERKDNRRISRERILVEHAIRFVKRFRILSERYRNRRHRFVLCFSLMAGICNFDRFS